MRFAIPLLCCALVADLKPGTYEVYCPRDDDAGKPKDKGMTTLLTVQ